MTYHPRLWGDLTLDVFGWAPGRPLPYSDLDDLASSGEHGNGRPVRRFDEGQYVNLADGTKATYDGSEWSLVVAPEPVPEPAPEVGDEREPDEPEPVIDEPEVVVDDADDESDESDGDE